MFNFALVIAFAALPSSSGIMAQTPQKPPLSSRVSLLEVYESPTPPPGAAKNYPVGHAVVRLRLENLTQNTVNLGPTKVEIRQANTNKILLSQVVQPFHLFGLQILERGFHITNQQGFGDVRKVKAVFDYQLNGKIYTVESPILEVVTRH